VRQTTMAVHDESPSEDAQIRVRGVEKQRGDRVPRGFLQVVQASVPAPTGKESGRRELAEWITSKSNPLTARVMVNRLWTWLFGAGIVRTVDNFGTTGEAPTHPELLDYLAVKFQQQGWSMKRLVREMVLSRTWQQRVQSAPANDPEHKLWCGMLRRRLDAEQLRDSMLAVSGQLDLAYLGPNIAGAGDVDANNFSAQNIEYGYNFTDTKRSVYTPAFRNKRLELFEIFDFGDINQPVGQRNVSTVAPQALFFLNHPFVLAQAESAAKRWLAESAETRLNTAFQHTLGRLPTPRERERCEAFLSGSSDPVAWSAVQQTLFSSLDFRYLP
jgi:hypothetical protein